MELNLYQYTGPHNIINKTLGPVTRYQGSIKSKISPSNVYVTVKNRGVFHYNYAYIPTFDRYYYVDNVVYHPHGVCTIELTVDVLQTYRRVILDSEGTVTKRKSVNPYNSSISIVSETRCEVLQYESNVSITPDPCTIMVVMSE